MALFSATVPLSEGDDPYQYIGQGPMLRQMLVKTVYGQSIFRQCQEQIYKWTQQGYSRFTISIERKPQSEIQRKWTQDLPTVQGCCEHIQKYSSFIKFEHPKENEGFILVSCITC